VQKGNGRCKNCLGDKWRTC